ncbi:entericidin A/B family lipoprotein [Actibacterium sp. 188UL27-1]|nr:entericidin A/B family lipoprotein [Actibacterium sp. 188UL27-1]MBM7069795.1 entericidin A/B family lipoprotein [Actibacterium sp. 188UL27-1]
MLRLILIGVTVTLLAGCETVEGFGRDVEDAGGIIQDEASG